MRSADLARDKPAPEARAASRPTTPRVILWTLLGMASASACSGGDSSTSVGRDESESGTGATSASSTATAASTSTSASSASTSGTTSDSSAGTGTTGTTTSSTHGGSTEESSGGTETTTGGAPLDDGHVRTVCGADDSPLLALEFGLEPGTCGWNPLEGRKVIIALNLGFDPLEPGEYPLQEPDDWARIDPLGEQDWHETSKGIVIIESWDDLGVSGSFTLDFEGLPLVQEDFAGVPFCDETMMCI